MKILHFLCLCLLALTACKPQTPPVSTPMANEWLGKWNGPEGTSLTIALTASGYKITVRNLDGPRTFPAIIKGDTLTFSRDNIAESIRPGTGAKTGMKWLVDKQNCLVVKNGEGYCRP